MRNRRDFIKQAAFAGLGTVAGGCMNFGSGGRAPAIAGDFGWGVLLHLGSNMWGDWAPDGNYPSSREEERKMFPNPKPRENGSYPNVVRNYLGADEAVWREQTEYMRDEGLNLVMIDVGEAYAYPSHPELWVKGSWDPDRMRAELKRLRGLGLEPVPKLNFSAGHDIWLKEYHYMTSSRKYYEVVADLIRDVCAVFDRPRYFHLGFDEEVAAAVKGRKLAVMRQGDLWWNDFNFCVREVERHGTRAMLWSDKICGGKEDFLKRMSKGVLQVPWYYGADFSEEKLKWKPEFETSQDWSVQRNLASSIVVLADAGFDVMPCTSNWSSDEAADAMIGFCKRRVDPAQLKGFLTAPWFMTLEGQSRKLKDGIRLFAAAKRKHYPAL